MFLNLIPVSAQRENIRNLYPHLWEPIRKHAYNKTQYKCTYCGGQGRDHPVEAHEEWVFVGNTIKLIDVIPLCPSCHKIKHINFYRNHPVTFRRLVRYYQNLNNTYLNPENQMSYEDAMRYIYEAIDMAYRHDKVPYTIDKKSIELYAASIV